MTTSLGSLHPGRPGVPGSETGSADLALPRDSVVRPELEPDFDRSVLFATTCGLIAGQLLRNRRRNQVVDPLGVAVGAGASAHPARDVATWLTREIGAAARNEMHLMAAFGTGLALAYLAGASHGLAKGEPRDAPYTS